VEPLVRLVTVVFVAVDPTVTAVYEPVAEVE
jgi:hypothetical protein